MVVKDVVPDQETEDVQDLVVIAEGDHDRENEIDHEIVEEAVVEIKDRQLNEIMIKKKKDLKTQKNIRVKADMLVNILILTIIIPIIPIAPSCTEKRGLYLMK